MNIVRFFETLKRKKEIDKDIKEVKLDTFQDFRERINFYLCENTHVPFTINFPLTSYYPLIKLDDEDIEYFYKKYYNKIQENKEKEISNILEKYKDL